MKSIYSFTVDLVEEVDEKTNEKRKKKTYFSYQKQ